jgi:hypothetical protein
MAEAYEPVWTLQEGALYFAVNPQSDPAAVQALRDALTAVKQSGEHAEILKAYR